MNDESLRLPGETIHDEADELYDRLGEELMSAAQAAVEQRGVFHLALSGGSTPEPFYVRLVIDPAFRAFPWAATHLWIVDERRVPEDDERSNFRMIRETLTDHVPIRTRNVHPMPVLTADPAGDYEGTLRTHVPDGRLDFILLGMGDDAHTASLFPRSEALAENDRWIAVNDGPAVTPPPRLTMTYPLLNAARELAVLVTGQKKALTLQRLADVHRTASAPLVEQFPILGIRPTQGRLRWFVDRAAHGDVIEVDF